MVGRNGLFDVSSGQHAALLFCGIRGRDSAGIGRLAPITARTAPIASAYSHEAHNDGAAGEYAKSRPISLVKQKVNRAPKTIKSLCALNKVLLCLLIANLFYRKIRPDSINIRALINRDTVVFSPKLCTIIISNVLLNEHWKWLFTLNLLKRTVVNLDCHWLLVGARARNDPDNHLIKGN